MSSIEERALLLQQQHCSCMHVTCSVILETRSSQVLRFANKRIAIGCAYRVTCLETGYTQTLQRSHMFAICLVVLQPSRCAKTPHFLGGGLSSEQAARFFLLSRTFCRHMLGIDRSRGIIAQKLSDDWTLS